MYQRMKIPKLMNDQLFRIFHLTLLLLSIYANTKKYLRRSYHISYINHFLLYNQKYDKMT